MTRAELMMFLGYRLFAVVMLTLGLVALFITDEPGWPTLALVMAIFCDYNADRIEDKAECQESSS